MRTKEQREAAWAAYVRRVEALQVEIGRQAFTPHLGLMRAAFMAGWYDGSRFAFDTCHEDIMRGLQGSETP